MLAQKTTKTPRRSISTFARPASRLSVVAAHLPGRYAAEALEVLTLEGTQVKEMTAFMTPQVFPRFGLPETLSPDVG